LLGERYGEIASGLQRFHESPSGSEARGWFRVTRGGGWLGRLIGWLGGFPPAAERVPVVLRVGCAGGREHWDRSFGERHFRSVQWQAGELFAERAGPMVLYFRLEVTAGVVRYHSVSVRMLGILPLPRWLAPDCSAEERPVEGAPDSWEADIQMRLPGLGLVLRYQGVVTPVSPAAQQAA
jgi:hypothetical protein